MPTNSLTQKLLAIAVDRIESYFDGTLKLDDQVGTTVKNVLDGVAPAVKKRFPIWQTNLRTFRKLSPDRQRIFLGQYYDRRLIADSSLFATPTHTTPTIYKETQSHLAKPELLSSLKPGYEQNYYATITLEMDEIYIAKEDDWGKAEVIVIGGASDGVRAHGLVSDVKSLGENKTCKYYGEHRIAVPKWPLSSDGTSNIMFYCEVREIDSGDHDKIVSITGGAGAIAGAIIGGLVKGGIIGGPQGAIAGAAVGAIVGLTKLLVGLNDDDNWGNHQICLNGPYPIPSENPDTIIKAQKMRDVRYELRFIQRLEAVKPLHQCKYKIDVVTGSKKNAGTDANVYISIKGSKARTGEIRLDNLGHNDFERNQTNHFELVLDDLGDLEEVKIRHDNTGKGPGWFLEKIMIMNPTAEQTWEFPCHQWLATTAGDGKICRTLPVQNGHIVTPVLPYIEWWSEKDFKGKPHTRDLHEVNHGKCIRLQYNDEMKSIKFYALPGWKLYLYDSPDCKGNDDWGVLTFPNDSKITVVEVPRIGRQGEVMCSPKGSYKLYKKDGLPGKVSSIRHVGPKG